VDNYQPRRLIIRILEYAVLFALSGFLIRLAVRFILEIWPVLLILAVAAAIIAVGYRVWKNKVKW